MEYPFDSIWINGRDISIQDIGNKTVSNQNPFEQGVFDFIYDWLNNVQSFSLQTSGSTGAPKEIQVTRAQMISSARLTDQALGLRPGSTALLCLDPHFIAGKMMLVRSFVSGMKILAVTPSSRVLDLIPGVKIELAAMVPYQIQEILQSNQRDRFNNIRLVLAGGAALNEKTKNL